MMCKDHYTICVTPQLKYLMDSARFFEVHQRSVQAGSCSLPKTNHFSSTGQRGFLENLRTDFKARHFLCIICHGFTRMSVCSLDDMVQLGFNCGPQEPLSQTVKPGIWMQWKLEETLCHLDVETNKSMLPSGEGSWNFWCWGCFKLA